MQNRKQVAIIILTGVWRSLVARTAGGREVAGSNPVAPIEDMDDRNTGIQRCISVFFMRKISSDRLNLHRVYIII